MKNKYKENIRQKLEKINNKKYKQQYLKKVKDMKENIDEKIDDLIRSDTFNKSSKYNFDHFIDPDGINRTSTKKLTITSSFPKTA